MTCEQVGRLLAPFVGGQLDAGKRRAVELHVQGCAVCAKELADLKGTIEALHSLDSMPVPAGFVERVRSRVEARVDARFRLWAWAAPVAAIAALALGLGALRPLVQPRHEPPRAIIRDRPIETAPEPAPTAPREMLDRAGAKQEVTESKDAKRAKAVAPPAAAATPEAPQKAEARAADSGPEALADAGYWAFDGTAAPAPSPGGVAEVRPDQQVSQPAQEKSKPAETVKGGKGVTIPPVSLFPPAGTAESTVKAAPRDETRPTIRELRTDHMEADDRGAGYSAATAGDQATRWASDERAQSQLVLLARNDLKNARLRASEVAKDAPIVVAALASEATRDRVPALYLNVQSMRESASAEVTLGNLAPTPAPVVTGMKQYGEQADWRVLWKGTLDGRDVKTVSVGPATTAPFVQRADIQVAATEPAPAGAKALGKLPASEVVNFALFVPPDLGRAQPGTKASYTYVQQPLDVVFGDLSARSGLALLVREPHGRIVDLHTRAITAQEAIRLLAKQQGYQVIPDAVAWTIY